MHRIGGSSGKGAGSEAKQETSEAIKEACYSFFLPSSSSSPLILLFLHLLTVEVDEVMKVLQENLFPVTTGSSPLTTVRLWVRPLHILALCEVVPGRWEVRGQGGVTVLRLGPISLHHCVPLHTADLVTFS